MDKIVEFPKKLFREFKRLPQMQQIAIVAIVVLAAYWLWKNYGSRLRREGFGDQKGSEPGTLTCTMYYVDWCPHCKTAKPEWKKLMDMFHGKTINGKKVLVVSIDCEKYPDVAKKQNVTGYPTFKFDLDGKPLNFNGERQFNEFKRFIESVL
jgi:thiol-disulfide isomerase/thioredoxin